jgi:hypothetical protein
MPEKERNMKTRFTIFTAVIALAASSLFAQTNDPQAAPAPTAGTIQQRKQNQQDRVANGIDSGQLTAGETKNLEKDESNLNHNERDMRAEDGGKLTTADRDQLNKEENHVSGQIYQDKHNANTTDYGKGEVGQRRENQQDRIANGIRSGQMTPGEATRTENKEQGLNREVSGMRQENNGKLTASDRKVVNHQQNQLSRQIYRQKHNGRRGV